jgi:hypothetical protein
MAKSLRAKNRQAAGRKKRATGHYAVAEAARVQRLSEKLLGKTKASTKEGEEVDGEGDAVIGEEAEEGAEDAVMEEGEFGLCSHGTTSLQTRVCSAKCISTKEVTRALIHTISLHGSRNDDLHHIHDSQLTQYPSHRSCSALQDDSSLSLSTCLEFR